MATAASAPVNAADAFSADQRKLIVSALELKAASLTRAIRAATNEAVQIAYTKELSDVNHLIGQFR